MQAMKAMLCRLKIYWMVHMLQEHARHGCYVLIFVLYIGLIPYHKMGVIIATGCGLVTLAYMSQHIHHFFFMLNLTFVGLLVQGALLVHRT